MSYIPFQDMLYKARRCERTDIRKAFGRPWKARLNSCYRRQKARHLVSLTGDIEFSYGVLLVLAHRLKAQPGVQVQGSRFRNTPAYPGVNSL